MHNVEITDSEAFFAAHRAEQDRVKATAPEQTMEARLRPYFPVSIGGKPVIFSIEQDGKVVAIAECMRDEEGGDPHALALCYVTVDEQYRDRRLATALVGSMIQYAVEQGYKAIDSSYYTKDGSQYLQKLLRRQSNKIEIRESGKTYRPKQSQPKM